MTLRGADLVLFSDRATRHGDQRDLGIVRFSLAYNVTGGHSSLVLTSVPSKALYWQVKKFC